MPDPRERFRVEFGHAPTHVSEAPGRVNLIGDHTDYNELPVLPIALAERVRLWIRVRDDGQVRLGSARFPDEPEAFALEDALRPRRPGDWRNYARAAAAGMSTVLPADARGFDGWMASDLPSASGLSSSSAVVVAVAHALLRLNDVDIPPLEMAVLAARAERFVGTQGGGMDQAAAFCGKAGSALRIDFTPLRVRAVPVPVDWRFVVAFSGVGAEKSGPAQNAYNERVASCRAALDRMGEAVGVDRALSYPALLAHGQLSELLDVAERVLESPALERFRHTVTEARRVDRAVAALEAGDAARFGRLMTESHESLRTDYQVSTDLLDALADSATAAGASGARLTGAGFGGSVVALALPSTHAAVREALERTLKAAGQHANGHVFTARPSDGAAMRPVGDVAID